MALPSSGAISMSNVDVELGRSSTAQICLNCSSVRTLFGKSSGTISLACGYGKSNKSPYTGSYLIVAGGGSGGLASGCGGGGGGGAGGMLCGTKTFTPCVTYTVTVGGGGTNTTNPLCSTALAAANGSSSSVTCIVTSTGGGAGYGRNGGSGGGGSNYSGFSSPGSGISGQGYRGGYVTCYEIGRAHV